MGGKYPALTVIARLLLIPGTVLFAGMALASSELSASTQSTNSDRPTQLFSGQAVFNLSAQTGEQQHFFINVPEGASVLVVQTLGGTGDADLYIRYNAQATEFDYDCSSIGAANDERCTFEWPPAGRYFILLDAWVQFEGVTLQANYQTETRYNSIKVAKRGDGDGTVQTHDARIICGHICSASFSSASTITLNATASAGSEFAGWDGDCSGTASCTLSTDSAKDVIANFQSIDPPEPEPARVDSTYSGLWFNPEQDGHGLSISVHSPGSATIFWYTYDPFGAPIWIIGPGQIVEDRIEADALYFFGMKFGDWSIDDRNSLEWGRIELTFDGCNSGILSYESDLTFESGEDFGAGEIPLVRLASVDGPECQHGGMRR